MNEHSSAVSVPFFTYSLTGGDLEDLGGETDGALDAKLLVLSTVDQIVADYSTHILARYNYFYL